VNVISVMFVCYSTVCYLYYFPIYVSTREAYDDKMTLKT
jgi:hypothetical protein